MMSIYDDVKGMLSLYEDSFFTFEDESIMEEVWEFTSEKLKRIKIEDMDPTLAMLVPHALEIPLHSGFSLTLMEDIWCSSQNSASYRSCRVLILLVS